MAEVDEMSMDDVLDELEMQAFVHDIDAPPAEAPKSKNPMIPM